jgi:hypothetical protein
LNYRLLDVLEVEEDDRDADEAFAEEEDLDDEELLPCETEDPDLPDELFCTFVCRFEPALLLIPEFELAGLVFLIAGLWLLVGPGLLTLGAVPVFPLMLPVLFNLLPVLPLFLLLFVLPGLPSLALLFP